MNERLRALNRFGLGARIGEVEELDAPRRWLHDQVDAAPSDDGGDDLPTVREIGAAFSGLREAQRSRSEDAIADARRGLRELVATEVSAAFARRVRSERPFVERLVAFWSNHLCVSASSKQQVAAFAGHYERTAIRPHVLGRFEDLVMASAKHPAMLFYLDNFQSIGPDSLAGRRSARGGNARGLNENYARELLELHTLGVDGGCGQDHVEALARTLTGWTVAGGGPAARDGETMRFAFRPILHEPGAKTVLGTSYGGGSRRRGGGVEEGEEAIRDLCRRPSSSRSVATQLVLHFASDDLPALAVVPVAVVVQESRGDLREVAHAVVELDEAWTTRHRKFRPPQEWLVAVLRAFRVEEVPERAPGVLRQLRHSLWAPPSPKGYEDTQGPWSDPDALMNRAELARSIARPMRIRDPRVVLSVIEVEDGDPLHDALGDPSIPVRDRVALGIGGPTFQWR